MILGAGAGAEKAVAARSLPVRNVPPFANLNTVGSDVAGWIYQQDYMTFLAVLGWLTAGLIAWGNAATREDARAVPWKWCAFFCLLQSLDGTLDLAKMINPEIWPRGFGPIFRLTGYGFLLEFARRGAVQLRWIRVGWWASATLAFAALVVVNLAPASSPVPESVVAFLAGTSAAAVILARMTRSSRALLVTAAALVLVGPVEMLRSQGGVAINGLYGLFVTGEGFETAICACAIAWVASLGLWLHGVRRRKTGLFAGRPEAASPTAWFILPVIVAGTLVSGFFIVNASSANVRHAIERDYLYQVRTAALSIDPEMLAQMPAPANTGGGSSIAATKLLGKLRALQGINAAALRVYLWSISGGRPAVFRSMLAGRPGVGDAAIHVVGVNAIPTDFGAHLIGPVGSRESTVIVANAPIGTLPGGTFAWLGIDISARDWLTSQASVRLLTIAVVGLFASVVVFFLAHQMLREYESELLVGKERAEAADRAKDEFVAVMSHEIRTPMQSVLGYGELLARTRLTPVQNGYLDTIRGQGRTLLRIVQDILDFSILRKSSYTLKSEEVYLHQVAQTAFESVRPLAARKHLTLELNLAREVPEVVRGDGVRIEQILLNLLGNAVKFTDRGSVQLDVSLERTELRGEDDASWVRFVVSDTGMGIRQADVRRLFQPFTRLTYDEHTPREGAGLGLAIVKRLCQLMGGDVAIESEWGRGTRFIVSLPLPVLASPPVGVQESGRANDADGAAAATIENLGAVLPLRVLVAEDNPYVRQLMIEYLRAIGYEPTAVGTGRDAAERWRDFDLFIMDLRMPVMDGVQAAAQIRAAARHPTEPWIIGVSATLSEGEVQRAMQAGMNDFLGKPFFVQSVIEAIQASPLYARRKVAPPAPPAAPNEPAPKPATAVADTAPSASHSTATGMSWMPDLSENGGSEIVQKALEEIPGILDEIGDALAAGDKDVATDRAHYLKNTIFALRMDPLVASCRSVHDSSASGDAAAARAALDVLRAAFADWMKDREAKAAAAPAQPLR